MAIELILRQPNSTHETRTVMHAAMLENIPVQIAAEDILLRYSAQLRQGTALPIGSVEYVRAAMQIGRIKEPVFSPYPQSLWHMLHRKIEQIPVAQVRGEWFVKPVKTKLFNGFTLNTSKPPGALCEHDLEQFNIFSGMRPDELVWISTTVKFVAEWRYYILDGLIAGQARYDPDGENDAPDPDYVVVKNALKQMTAAFPRLTCSLDVGVLEDGRTALVECNDAWALGLYGKSLEPRTYLQMLQFRWGQMMAESVGQKKAA